MTTPAPAVQSASSLPAVAGAAGTAEVTFTCPNGYQWAVTQISSYVTGSQTAGQLLVFCNQAFVCGSSAPALDSADGGYILLKAGDVLSLLWETLTPGSACQGTIFYTPQAV